MSQDPSSFPAVNMRCCPTTWCLWGCSALLQSLSPWWVRVLDVMIFPFCLLFFSGKQIDSSHKITLFHFANTKHRSLIFFFLMPKSVAYNMNFFIATSWIMYYVY